MDLDELLIDLENRIEDLEEKVKRLEDEALILPGFKKEDEE